MPKACLPIKAVVQRTGLSSHVIRIWEKRYGAVEPARTGTNRRLYSEEELERLILLRDLTQAGHSISQVATLALENLRDMAAKESAASTATAPARSSATPNAQLLTQAVEAVKRLDSPALEQVLLRGSTELGAQGLLQKMIAPLIQTIGDQWREGSLTAAHEHFASAVIRIFLGHAARPFAAADNAPVLIVATPNGQLHELGALLVGAAATNLGWHVTCLGASLPAAEIAGAARQGRARAVALSLVYPEDDPRLEGELKRLRELLPDAIPILVGGRAMPAYRVTLDAVGALQMKDLDHFCAALDELRRPARKANV